MVYEDGRLHVFSDNFQDYTEISLFEDDWSDEIILEAKFIGDESITILTSENNFITLDLFEMKKIKYVRPDCLAFNSPQNWFPTSDGSVIFALNSCLYKITSDDELTQKKIVYETICQLSYDEKSEDLLILTSDCRVLVVNEKEFKVKTDVDVKEYVDVYSISGIHWFVNSVDGIIIAALSSTATGKIIFVDLSEGITSQITIAKNFSIIRETDGLRMIQNGRNWLVTSMPTIISELNSGKSKLSDFYEMFSNKDFEGIRALSNVNLSELIDQGSKSLLSLAYEQQLQENFINSLKFAVKIIEEKLGSDENSKHIFSYITANFNRALMECSVLKKLNSNGMAVSPSEFKNNLCDETILRRICRIDMHGLAFEIAILLDSDLSVILLDWIKKVLEKSAIEDKRLWEMISDKLLTWGGLRANHVDYIELAEYAKKKGKSKLALKLLKLEKDTKKKIDLLVELNDYREAVIESVQAGKQDQSNSNLIYFINNILFS